MIRDWEKFIRVLIAFEGIELKAYKDSVGVSTIGIGSTTYPDGRRVKMGETITEAEAFEYAKFEAKAKLKAISQLVKAEQTENQWIAILSLVYNIGSGGFAISSMLRSINQKASVEVIGTGMKMWNKGTINGKKVVLSGLTDRRQVEFEIYSGKLNIEKDTTKVVKLRMAELYQVRKK